MYLLFVLTVFFLLAKYHDQKSTEYQQKTYDAQKNRYITCFEHPTKAEAHDSQTGGGNDDPCFFHKMMANALNGAFLMYRLPFTV